MTDLYEALTSALTPKTLATTAPDRPPRWCVCAGLSLGEHLTRTIENRAGYCPVHHPDGDTAAPAEHVADTIRAAMKAPERHDDPPPPEQLEAHLAAILGTAD